MWKFCKNLIAVRDNVSWQLNKIEKIAQKTEKEHKK